jgi:tetratricopeptide (TPR) repeat protein
LSSTAEPVGTIEVALAHATRLLAERPQLAIEQASEILKAAPGHPPAVLLLATARRCSGETDAALQILEQLVRLQPRWAAAHFELALTQIQAGLPAIAALERAVALRPNMPDAWRTLGDQLTVAGDLQRADAAYAQHLKASTHDPRLMSAAAALVENRIAQAEMQLKTHLKQFPTDVAAIRMLAEVAARIGRNRDAEVLLERCLELMPSFHAARHQYAIVLQRQNKVVAALREIAHLEKIEPHNPTYRNLEAVVLVKIGEYQQSLELYAEVLASNPNHDKIWLSYGHTLSTAGRERDSIDAYRRAIKLTPHLGEAYWSLANLKTFRFEPNDVAAMQAQLARNDLKVEDRFHFEFALGKALEDAQEFACSFEHYASANRLRHLHIGYDQQETSDFVQRSKQVFSADFFQERAGHGWPAADPIFIVGLPRSGSTLIEQILSSHSSVEGTMELPDILAMAGELSGRRQKNAPPVYPAILSSLDAQGCRRLGQQYLEQTRIQRKTTRPLFIDKMPNNFLHIGLIQLILPNARIIDARRHPMACCFSVFKQQFAQGHTYAYSLEDLGRYYRDYVELMSHFDTVLPGRIHRVIYEQMVDDTEGEVRRLLQYCGLPFEEQCLRFYQNKRPVRTVSAHQVRQPIFRDAVEHWRNYEPWLAPLRRELGAVMSSYPAVPRNFNSM